MATNGRTQCPWSDRRVGVYHKHDSSKSVWVVLQPTNAALELPQAAYKVYQRECDPVRLHMLLFSSTMPAWIAYLTYLEALVKTIVRRCSAPVPLSLTNGIMYSFRADRRVCPTRALISIKLSSARRIYNIIPTCCTTQC